MHETGTAPRGHGQSGEDATKIAERYLDLLATMLTRDGFPPTWRALEPPSDAKRAAARAVNGLLARGRLELVRQVRPEFGGTYRHAEAETMIGRVNLDSLRDCIASIMRDGVPGDLIETGVWRGGAAIFMRGALEALGDRERTVWVADSFRGLPKPNEQLYPADRGDSFYRRTDMAVPLDEVKANFARYGLLDDRVLFLEGWFSETLPTAPIERLAVLRIDGDMYESTMDAFGSLYPKLSVGGYAIVDDFHLERAKAATMDYRAQMRITEEIVETGSLGCVFWRRTR